MLIRKQLEHVSSSGKMSFIVTSFSGVDCKKHTSNISFNTSVSSQREHRLPFVLPHRVHLVGLAGILFYESDLNSIINEIWNDKSIMLVETQKVTLLIFSLTKTAEYRFEHTSFR